MPSITKTLSDRVYRSNWITGYHPDRDQLEWVLISSGDTAFHDNVILFGIVNNTPTPSLVAKASRLSEHALMLENEFNQMQVVWELCKHSSIVTMPRPIAFEMINNQPLLIMSFAPGYSFPSYRNKQFWYRDDQVRSLMIRAARAIGEIHTITSKNLQTGEKVDSNFPAKTDAFLSSFRCDQNEKKIIKDLTILIRNRSHKALTKRIVQGDFWHGNMLGSNNTQKITILDWQFACWNTDASFDVYLFILAAALSASRGYDNTTKAKGAKEILVEWLADIIPAFIDTYQTDTSSNILPIREGFLMTCIEKAARSITDFGYHHREDHLWREMFNVLCNFSEH